MVVSEALGSELSEQYGQINSDTTTKVKLIKFSNSLQNTRRIGSSFQFVG